MISHVCPARLTPLWRMMLEQYYGQVYNIASIDCQTVPGGIKGKEPGFEHIWILRRLNATHAGNQHG
jgi:hypothetical protein